MQNRKFQLKPADACKSPYQLGSVLPETSSMESKSCVYLRLHFIIFVLSTVATLFAFYPLSLLRASYVEGHTFFRYMVCGGVIWAILGILQSVVGMLFPKSSLVVPLRKRTYLILVLFWSIYLLSLAIIATGIRNQMGSI